MSNSDHPVSYPPTDIPVSGDHYKAVAEAASDAIITINVNSTILLVNPAAEKIFGYTTNELLGRQLTILMPHYHRHLHREGMARYLETGKRHLEWGAVKLPGLHKSGKEIALEISFLEFVKDGQKFFTGIVRKVASQKPAQADPTRDLLSAIVNQASVGISVVDRNGQFTFVNDWFCQLLNRTREELLKTKIAEITYAEDFETSEIFFKRAIADCQSFEIEKRYIHASGSLVKVLEQGNIFYDEDGSCRGILNVTLDLSAGHSKIKHDDHQEMWS